MEVAFGFLQNNIAQKGLKKYITGKTGAKHGNDS
jgi:hypothetical protein